MEEQKTSSQWMEQYPTITILDPDGWDRTNYGFSFYEELITNEEFQKRLSVSTISLRGIIPSDNDQ